LLGGQAILLMLPNGEVRSRSWFSNLLVVIFILLVLANLISALAECGLGPCADNPVNYDGWTLLRFRFGF